MYQEQCNYFLWKPNLIIYLDAPSKWIISEMRKKQVPVPLYFDASQSYALLTFGVFIFYRKDNHILQCVPKRFALYHQNVWCIMYTYVPQE